MDFKGDKNPLHIFLRRGSKAGDVRSSGMLKKSRGMKEIFCRQNPHFLHPDPPNLLLDGSADIIARALWWTNHEFSPVDIISP
jgi:hypothetical protein